MNLNNTTIPFVNDVPKIVLYKKVFICLPVNLLYSEVVLHQDEIYQKLKKYFPNHTILINKDPAISDDLNGLARSLDEIVRSDLVIFGVGWSSSKSCAMIHQILEEYNGSFMYEWELDLPDALISDEKEGGKAND